MGTLSKNIFNFQDVSLKIQKNDIFRSKERC